MSHLANNASAPHEQYHGSGPQSPVPRFVTHGHCSYLAIAAVALLSFPLRTHPAIEFSVMLSSCRGRGPAAGLPARDITPFSTPNTARPAILGERRQFQHPPVPRTLRRPRVAVDNFPSMMIHQ
ncbi:hypothetical protein BO71DRAFT_400827 [Aspergillus ellipticus CBS 707.79]|uniref:Uncharacterized protein n=1 Tax=Aspergillus ellipticus CBS 707.79 TaxID=1448320 RepID=A0A319D4A4_9EURO|nr:hypothetical protein BO71DRAFT_400827 [Aspergillus ellipticus CBS 707.79]